MKRRLLALAALLTLSTSSVQAFPLFKKVAAPQMTTADGQPIATTPIKLKKGETLKSENGKFVVVAAPFPIAHPYLNFYKTCRKQHPVVYWTAVISQQAAYLAFSAVGAFRPH